MKPNLQALERRLAAIEAALPPTITDPWKKHPTEIRDRLYSYILELASVFPKHYIISEHPEVFGEFVAIIGEFEQCIVADPSHQPDHLSEYAELTDAGRSMRVRLGLDDYALTSREQTQIRTASRLFRSES